MIAHPYTYRTDLTRSPAWNSAGCLKLHLGEDFLGTERGKADVTIN
jgi:hypothetical protein